MNFEKEGDLEVIGELNVKILINRERGKRERNIEAAAPV